MDSAICDGSVVSDAASIFNGKTLPDKRSVFAVGHSTLTNANFSADTTYYTGGTIPSGGASSLALAHSHTEGSHDHGINTDNAAHQHTISSDGGHQHNTNGDVGTGGLESIGTGTLTTVDGSHTHGGDTGSDNASHNHTGSTTFAAGGGTGGALTTYSILPPYAQYVWIFKIK
jgi:hypothetical protein